MQKLSEKRELTSRPVGLSAFVRCKNEEEYIVASLLSVYRIFDEIVVILNNSTDRTRELVEELIVDHPKIRIVEYPHECAAVGVKYFESVSTNPISSIAKYYNWCVEQTEFSHVCKWDGDMIAIPPIEGVLKQIPHNDVVCFDGYDVLAEDTTNSEPRIFRYDPSHATYVDWDLYEVLQHRYDKIVNIEDKCYLHMKLVKMEWVHRAWSNPNLLAIRSAPDTGANAYRKRSIPWRAMNKLKYILGMNR
jgi:glycosyltransferase involved in cell wall biosynthesis